MSDREETDQPQGGDELDALLPALLGDGPLAEHLADFLERKDGPLPAPDDEVQPAARSAERRIGLVRQLWSDKGPEPAPAPLPWALAAALLLAVGLLAAWALVAPEQGKEEGPVAAAQPREEEADMTTVGDRLLLRSGVVAIRHRPGRPASVRAVVLTTLGVSVEPLGTTFVTGLDRGVGGVSVLSGAVRLVRQEAGEITTLHAGQTRIITLDDAGKVQLADPGAVPAGGAETARSLLDRMGWQPEQASDDEPTTWDGGELPLPSEEAVGAVGRAIEQLSRQDATEASLALSRALAEAEPADLPRLRFWEAYALAELGLDHAAIDQVDRLLVEDRTGEYTPFALVHGLAARVRIGDLAPVPQAWIELLLVAPTPGSADSLAWMLGRAALQAGHPEAAVEALRQVATGTRGYSRVGVLLGEAWLAQGRSQAATLAWRATLADEYVPESASLASELDACRDDALFRLARTHEDQGRRQAARTLYTLVDPDSPWHADALAGAARCSLAIGDPLAAADFLEREATGYAPERTVLRYRVRQATQQATDMDRIGSRAELANQAEGLDALLAEPGLDLWTLLVEGSDPRLPAGLATEVLGTEADLREARRGWDSAATQRGVVDRLPGTWRDELGPPVLATLSAAQDEVEQRGERLARVAVQARRDEIGRLLAELSP